MENMEMWVDKTIKRYSEDSYNLFSEAILCYKVKAYRASLLFSYLAFFKYIKELLNKSKRPDSFPVERWDSILKEIQKEDKWEEKIFTSLQNSSTPVFNINENLRIQIKYWKDRRNDCAHAKNNIINHNHVEMFWTFLKSNLSKITVEGGKQNLLNKFSDHFDTTKTSIYEKYDDLINEIENSVEISDILGFIKDLDTNIINKTYNQNKVYEVYEKILSRYDDVNSIKHTLIKYLKDSQRDLDFLAANPHTFLYFDYDKQELRNIWYLRIFKCSQILRDKILMILLSNIIFQKEDLIELTNKYIDAFDQSGFQNLSKDIEFRARLANEYFIKKIYNDYFMDKKLIELDYRTINSKADLIALYIEKCSLSSNIVMTLSLVYKKVAANFLTDALKEVLFMNTEIKTKFEEICITNEIKNLAPLYNSKEVQLTL